MKISVVMQSYLHDYPGSRSEPEKKFIRAVNSFLDQTHEDKELIIVADGCSKTPEIFYKNWSSNSQIKFVFLHKNGPSMYEEQNGKKLFRGLPRKIGCTLASGDLITYMDSDDIILPHRLKDIYEAWKLVDDSFFWSNNTQRYMNVNNLNYDYEHHPDVPNTITLFKQYGLKSKYILKTMIPDYWLASPPSITHRKKIPIEWEDSFDISEDLVFLRKLLKTLKGFKQNSASYIICHCSNVWGNWDE